MIAVVIKRFNKSLKECFGVDSCEEIPFFESNLNVFLNRKLSGADINSVFEINCSCDKFTKENELKKLKNILRNNGDIRVFFTYSDVYFDGEKLCEFVKNIASKAVSLTIENEAFCWVFNGSDLLEILDRSNNNINSVPGVISEKIKYDGYVKIVENPLKYKALCRDILLGKVNYRLPEIAQGIYASSNIPKGDFILVPPVFLGNNIQLEKGCVIGPCAVISDGVLVAENSRISNTYLGENTYISTGCYTAGSMVSHNVILRRNSVAFDNSVLCHDVTVGEDAIVESGSFIRAYSKVDEYDKRYMDFKFDDTQSAAGFYGYTPEKAALLGASVGTAFDMPKIAVASDGELNSTALKLALLGGLITTGAACYDFGNTFFSSLHYFMDFCELDYGAFISGNDDGTVISIFKNGESALSKSDFYNIKSIFSASEIKRCSKNECKSVNQIHGMQRMYIQNLTSMFEDPLEFMPVFNCENKRVLSVAELAASKIGFKTGKNRVEFNINPRGTKVSAGSDGVVYPYSKLSEIVSYYQRKDEGFKFCNIYNNDSVILSFYIIKILSEHNLTLKDAAGNLPTFYVARKTLDKPYELRVLAADLSKLNRIDFRKNEIFYKEGLNSVKIKKNREGSLCVTAKALSMEAASEIVENLTSIIYESGRV